MPTNTSVHVIKAWAAVNANDIITLIGGDPLLSATWLYAQVQLSNKGLINPQGDIILDLASFTLDWGVNEIPQANLAVAAGREVNSGIPSAMHYLISVFRQRIPVYVWCEIARTYGPNNNDPFTGTPFLAFAGKTTGAGFRTNFGSAEFVITAAHWLVDLTTSSTVSASSSPTNPHQISYDSAMPIFRTAGVTPADTPLVQWGAILGGAVGVDFWGFDSGPPIQGQTTQNSTKGLRGALALLASDNRFNWKQILYQNPNCGAARSTSGHINDSAMAALRQFEPLPGPVDPLNPGNIGPGTYYSSVPLVMRANLLINATAAQSMAYEVASTSTQNLASTTFWDKLVGDWAPRFLFAVVPLVDRALIVPYCPGLRASTGSGSQIQVQVGGAIRASEIDYFEFMTSIPRPLRGIGLFVTKASGSGAFGHDSANVKIQQQTGFSTGALYDTCQDGVILFKDAPAWITNTFLPNNYTRGSTVAQQVPTNQSPAGHIPPQVDAMAPAFANLWTEYAHMLYVQEVLRHRQVRMGGKLRFDIAPGTLVSMQVPQDLFVSRVLSGQAPNSTGPLPPPQVLYGTVIRVTISVNCESQKASTNFHIAHVRDAQEDLDNRFSVQSHPVWAVDWRGAKLVDNV
jgi:hypothetical protein